MKIVLLYGGSCSERFVSFLSSKDIYKALIKNGHNVIAIDPALSQNQINIETISLDEFKNLDYLDKSDPKHLLKLFRVIEEIQNINPDIVFLGLHGSYGEDGFIQDCFDRLKIKYTGSNSISSKMAMDKHVSKKIMRQAGIRTANWVLVQSDDVNIEDIKKNIKFPCVVKPNIGGSSVGITIVKNKLELRKAIKLALKEDSQAMIESFIDGRELTVSILGNKAYPIIEIKPQGGIYDYVHKYTKGLTDYIVPAPILETLRNEIQKNARYCFKILGMSIYGRIDYRLTEKNKFYCLEANTLPGMTGTSLVPKSFKAGGINFENLVEMILSESVKE